MTSQEKATVTLFALLAAALKKVPGRQFEVDIDEEELRRHYGTTGPEDVRILVTNHPNGWRKTYRVMLQGDYSAWLKEKDKPKGRKMYLEEK